MGNIRIEPLLYDVVIHTPRHLKLTEEWYIKHGKHIHHLLALALDPVHFIEHCPNLRDLAILIPVSPRTLGFIENLQIERLLVDMEDLFGSAAVFQKRARASPPLFAHLTHLETIFSNGGWESWSGIALLPKLTHFAVVDEITRGDSIIQGALAHCRYLRVLIIVAYSMVMPDGIRFQQQEESQDPEASDDPRVVRAELGRHYKGWEFGAQGLPDMWSLADEIVEGRIRQFVPSRGEA